jgi:hypothetical protein
VQDDAAYELHVEVPHLEDAAAGFADDGERVGQHIVERFPLFEALPELGRLPAQLLVGEGLDLWFFRVDGGDEWAQPFQVTLVLRADDFRQESINNHQGTIKSGYLVIVQQLLPVPREGGSHGVVWNGGCWCCEASGRFRLRDDGDACRLY